MKKEGFGWFFCLENHFVYFSSCLKHLAYTECSYMTDRQLPVSWSETFMFVSVEITQVCSELMINLALGPIRAIWADLKHSSSWLTRVWEGKVIGVSCVSEHGLLGFGPPLTGHFWLTEAARMLWWCVRNTNVRLLACFKNLATLCCALPNLFNLLFMQFLFWM